MGETTADFSNTVGQLIVKLLHVLAVFGQQYTTRNFITQLVTITRHLRALGQHLFGNGELLSQNGRRSFFLGKFDTDFPADFGLLMINLSRELAREIEILENVIGLGTGWREEE